MNKTISSDWHVWRAVCTVQIVSSWKRRKTWVEKNPEWKKKNRKCSIDRKDVENGNIQNLNHFTCLEKDAVRERARDRSHQYTDMFLRTYIRQELNLEACATIILNAYKREKERMYLYKGSWWDCHRAEKELKFHLCTKHLFPFVCLSFHFISFRFVLFFSFFSIFFSLHFWVASLNILEIEKVQRLIWSDTNLSNTMSVGSIYCGRGFVCVCVEGNCRNNIRRKKHPRCVASAGVNQQIQNNTLLRPRRTANNASHNTQPANRFQCV